jgi:hypothetical protein
VASLQCVFGCVESGARDDGKPCHREGTCTVVGVQPRDLLTFLERRQVPAVAADLCRPWICCRNCGVVGGGGRRYCWSKRLSAFAASLFESSKFLFFLFYFFLFACACGVGGLDLGYVRAGVYDGVALG